MKITADNWQLIHYLKTDSRFKLNVTSPLLIHKGKAIRILLDVYEYF